MSFRLGYKIKRYSFKRKDNKNTVRLMVYIMPIEALRFKGAVEKVTAKKTKIRK